MMMSTKAAAAAAAAAAVEEEEDDEQHDKKNENEIIILPLPQPIQGHADWRSYRVFRIMKNGVTVGLVHDAKAKTTAAAACVNAGAAADPRPRWPGLAHFCEHMVFLGSDKYPGENDYKSYLAQHGGRSNASTSLHLTTYKFEVLAEHAETAIDMFSHFFVAPLFTESGTGREVNAVDSENSKNLSADTRRRLQILKDLADPNHYYSKFTTGNAGTLRTDSEEELEAIRQALLDFHRKHYRPDNLTVVVAGPQSLDQLQEWVVPRFAPMQARGFPDADDDFNVMTESEKLIHEAAQDAPPYGFEQPPAPFRSPFKPEYPQRNNNNNNNSNIKKHHRYRWPILLTTKPVRSMRRLVVMFPLPPIEKNQPDQSPISVLSHLLGHEGPHSSFSILQNEGLLSSLVAGPRVSAPDFTLFQVDLGLTENGERQWKDVVDILLQHCRLIHQAATLQEAFENDKNKNNSNSNSDSSNLGELPRIWGEAATLHAMFFHQTSPGSVYDFAPNLCRNIVQEGTEKCLSAGCMLEETKETFPLQAVLDFSSRLVASNCIIERCSKSAWEEMEENEKHNVKGVVERKTEPWYGIDYFLSEINQEDVDRWEGKEGSRPFLDGSQELKLPRPNRYIPRSLDLCADLPEEAKQGPRIENDIDPPRLIVDDTKIGRLWHRLDDRYALPKSIVSILIRNAAVDNVKVDGVGWQYNVEASVHSSILSGIIAEALAQETYDADLAGLHWGLSLTSSGILISCSGFSDRLSDLALKILEEFLSGSFLQESYFSSTKDRLIRNLRTYFESRRADSIAMYYRDLLLASKSLGLDVSLTAAETATLESTKDYHGSLLRNSESLVECFFTGNVSETEARMFFASASKLLSDASAMSKSTARTNMWIPGELERRLIPGQDIEFHFASQNTQEENGAVLMTYQSPIPGFRGDGLSTPESLESTASIRLISHILREPLFDELRTKQTLGYIVSSYYDVGVASRPPEEASLGPLGVPVDFLVINVLSRKLAPPEVAGRMEEFMSSFRETLVNMPDSEIHHHASALSTKLLKPIQKLETEASTHFSKIRRYAPEVLANGGVDQDLPWDSVKTLAYKIQSLGRQELIESWDRLILARNRSRLVSCVYGSTFPLPGDKNKICSSSSSSSKPIVVKNDLGQILELRKRFAVYDNNNSPTPRRRGWVWSNRTALGVTAVSVVGAAAWSILTRSKKTAAK